VSHPIEAHQNYPRLPVLVLSSAPEEQLAVRVLKAGASGYLNKQTATKNLVRAVRRILAGGKYVTAALAEKLATEVGLNATPLHEELSDREFQVLRMIASGKSVKEVADELSLSVKTVSTYRTRILEKTGMKTNADLIRYALQTQLVD